MGIEVVVEVVVGGSVCSSSIGDTVLGPCGSSSHSQRSSSSGRSSSRRRSSSRYS